MKHTKMLEAPNVPLRLTQVPAAAPKGVEVPEVPVAAVHQLVGHHRQQEREESKEEPDNRWFENQREKRRESYNN